MNTAQRLELVVSRGGSHEPRSSLLGVLDHCSTVSGKRSLRANILQPPTSLVKINSRLLSVTELAQSPALLHSIQVTLSTGGLFLALRLWSTKFKFVQGLINFVWTSNLTSF